MAFIMLRYVPSIATLMGVFCHELLLNLSNVYSVSVETIMWFLSFLLLVLCITFIDFLLTFYFVLVYSQLTMLWQFQVNSEAIHMHVSILPQAPLPSRPPHNTEQFPVLYSMSLSALDIAVCMCPSQTPQLSLLPSTSSNHEFILWVCAYLSVLWLSSFVSSLFRFHI